MLSGAAIVAASAAASIVVSAAASRRSPGGESTARADEDAARAKEALHASVVANAEGAALNASIELESPAKPCDAKPPRLKWREIWPFLGPPGTLVIDEATPLEGKTTAAASFDVALEFVVGYGR